MSGRATFLHWLEGQKGKPYVWASKGDYKLVGGTVQIECFDCSGLVTRGLVVAGYPATCPTCSLDLTGFHNAQRLFNELPPTERPQAGDLMFFGSGVTRVNHVMVWLDHDHCFGASGGNRDSVDPMVSLRRGQKVKRQPTNYRTDFLGFRILPLR